MHGERGNRVEKGHQAGRRVNTLSANAPSPPVGTLDLEAWDPILSGLMQVIKSGIGAIQWRAFGACRVSTVAFGVDRLIQPSRCLATAITARDTL